MESNGYLRNMYPRVRTVKNKEKFDPSKSDYIHIFKGVKTIIRMFLKTIFPSDLYPRDMNIRGRYLYNWRYEILDRYMEYSKASFVGLSGSGQIFAKALSQIGFTLWFGYGWRFPKHLTRSKFQHKLCVPFIDVARTACDNVMYLTQSQQRSYTTIRYFMRKIIYILSYEVV